MRSCPAEGSFETEREKWGCRSNWSQHGTFNKVDWALEKVYSKPANGLQSVFLEMEISGIFKLIRFSWYLPYKNIKWLRLDILQRKASKTN